MIFDEKLRWYVYWMLDFLKHKPVRSYYKEIAESWEKGTSIEKTEKRLRKLIEHAIDTTDFYRDFPKNIKLCDMPVVNKDIFQKEYDRFLSETYRNSNDNRIMYSSGSTGTPLRMVQNRDKINHNTAAGIFLGKAAGYRIGMKQAFLRVWVQKVRKSNWRLFQENLIMMDSSSMSEQMLGQVYQELCKKKVKCLVGYSSALGELSRYMKEHNKDGRRCSVRVIIPISETMPDPVRRTLEKQFGCNVRAWYSNEENGIMGLQNIDDNGYHIDTESYYYEILKMDRDEPAEQGELGRIVITDLYNFAFPIIRYDNGDTAIAEYRTNNDRYQLYLSELYGRRSDIIYDTSGNALSPYIITNNMWDITGMRQFRFIQEDLSEYTIWLNGNPEEIDTNLIRDRILKYLGKDAVLKMEFVDEIPVLASGKRKYIENRCSAYEHKKGFCG